MDQLNIPRQDEAATVNPNKSWLNIILKSLIIAGLIIAFYSIFTFIETLVDSATSGGWGDLGVAVVYGVFILPIAAILSVIVIFVFIRRLWKWGAVGLVVVLLLFISWPLADVVTNVHPKVVENEVKRYEKEAKLHEFELKQIQLDRLYPKLLFDFGNPYEIRVGEIKSLVIKTRYKDSQEPLRITLKQIRQLSVESQADRFVTFNENTNNSGSLVLKPTNKNIGEWLLVFEVTVRNNPDLFKEEYLRVKVGP